MKINPSWLQPAPETDRTTGTADSGTGRVSLVKLGGVVGRYWRGVARRLLTVVNPARVRIDEQTT